MWECVQKVCAQKAQGAPPDSLRDQVLTETCGSSDTGELSLFNCLPVGSDFRSPRVLTESCGHDACLKVLGLSKGRWAKITSDHNNAPCQCLTLQRKSLQALPLSQSPLALDKPAQADEKSPFLEILANDNMKPPAQRFLDCLGGNVAAVGAAS